MRNRYESTDNSKDLLPLIDAVSVHLYVTGSLFVSSSLKGSAKLEKAEILQMTVDHLKMLHAAGGKGKCPGFI